VTQDAIEPGRQTAGGYQLIDVGLGERLEQWGPYRLRRPDPRAAARRERTGAEWDAVDARYTGEAGRGRWERLTEVPERWTIEHGGLTLVVKLAPFKHTGVFPEQVEHWRWMTDAAAQVAVARPLEILNLFAYTGGATIALAKAGHKVTHVDASNPAIAWARENAAANGLAADAIRWIHDDAATFVRRELKRGRRYDAALMDPPAFGHAPQGRAARGQSVWRVDEHLTSLVDNTTALLDDPVFFLVNHYAREADASSLMEMIAEREGPWAQGRWEHGRLQLGTEDGRRLETGVYARWRPVG
jgi:23S rRNA (cytosine1962-C5)-methyltransferase